MISCAIYCHRVAYDVREHHKRCADGHECRVDVHEHGFDVHKHHVGYEHLYSHDKSS